MGQVNEYAEEDYHVIVGVVTGRPREIVEAWEEAATRIDEATIKRLAAERPVLVSTRYTAEPTLADRLASQDKPEHEPGVYSRAMRAAFRAWPRGARR